jgi:murein DD-endopeptidase MepM/ murein hydrolase activator NlpD
MAVRPRHIPQPAHVRQRARYITFKMRPLTLCFICIAGLAMGGWSAAVTIYAFFRDDVLVELISRQSSADQGYRDRINKLRAEIDVLQSQRMVERATFSDRLELLHRHQAMLEQRHVALTSLVGIASPVSSEEAGFAQPGVSSRAKPQPVGDSVNAGSVNGRQQSSLSSSEDDLKKLEKRFLALNTAQEGTLSQLEMRYDALRSNFASAYADLGIRPVLRKTAQSSPAAQGGMGGPYIPVSLDTDTDFSIAVGQAREMRAEVIQLRNGLRTLPLRNPAPGAEYTSSFGMRLDPFLKSMAFHSGVDFRVESGTPVAATAPGTVVFAGWNGGYGLMVEVDHGQGFSTRYGHLTGVAVKEGDKLAAGIIIGFSGSTGRSTGPHLHYETRIRDQAVNPERFLEVGKGLEGIL